MDVGDKFRIQATDYVIVGQFDAGGKAFESEIWVDVNSLGSTMKRESYSSVLLRVKDRATLDELAKRNLEVVKDWAEYYNHDVDRMVSECYAENCSAASILGGAKVEGLALFRKLEQRVLKAAPRRKIRVDHTHAAGDVVVVEATLFDPDRGDDWQSRFCAVLTFKDSRIVEDRTYLDETRWPGMQRNQ